MLTALLAILGAPHPIGVVLAGVLVGVGLVAPLIERAGR